MLLGLLAKEGITAGTVTSLTRLLATAGRPSSPAAARAMLTIAVNAGALTVDGQNFQVVGPDGEPLGPSTADLPTVAHGAETAEDVQLGPDAQSRPLRIVALDVEAAVRARVEDGGTLRRAIWQLGAVRFGPDQPWVDAQPKFSRYVTMPDDFSVPGHRATLHATQQVPAEQAMAALAGYLSDADMVVAYNGTGLDFPVLDGALEQAGQSPLPAARADGLYLAYCMWPGAESHRLADIVRHAGLTFAGTEHNAVDDAANLAALMTVSAQVLAGRDQALLAVLNGLTPNSHSWRMMRSLAGMSGSTPPQAPAQVAAVLWRALSPLPTRRGRPAAALQVTHEVRDTSGQVDPAVLARALHGASTEARPSQQHVTRMLRTVADDAIPALVEAPTGTGKSLSALAAALDWLGRDVRNTAIIATHTKALQSQLAREVEILSAVVPGLLESTDVIKGASNRLSLRGLVYTLADASGAEVGSAGHLVRNTDSEGFRELLAFLLLRLVEPDTRATYRWEAASVDVADLPAFFSEYCGKQVGAWTASLSQAAHGDYGSTGALPLAAWTNEVREALATHRLIVTNHALLLSHVDDLTADADRTLLIVDEAHSLEGAATDALSPSLSTSEIGETLASLFTLARDLASAAEVGGLVRSLGELRDWWTDGRLRRHVARTLDRCVGDVSVGSRTMTLASPFSGAQAGADARTVANLLHSLYGLCGRILGALGKVSETNAGRLDVSDEQRLLAAQQRLGSLTTVAEELSTTITALLDAPPPPAAIATPEQPSSEPTGAPATADGNAPGNDADDANGGEVGDGEDDPELTIAGAGAESADADDEDEATGKAASMPDDPEPEPLNHRSSDSAHASAAPGASATAPVPAVASAVPVPAVAPDRVAYLREDGELGWVGLEGYRFTIVSSPILLPNDTNWQAFTATFRRIGLLSATLQVQTPGKDSWAYVRGRLGLPDARAHVVGGPFDYDRQARLVALSDFPSWAEQPKQAMRTVAHQLSGWADQVAHRRGGDGPWMGGAMVLTTAKAAAAGIANEVLQLLAHSPDPVAVHSQVLLGTRRAVAEFTGPAPHQGGFLVGTRGLWTGVDVSEPDRMNLVWINKLPFPVFTDPVVAARREQVRRAAEDAGSDDPDLVATGEYYLPLAALDLRQAVGRLLRNSGSRGVVVISDRKLSGDLPLRRLYRQLFLGSLDAGLHVADPDTGEATGGNVMPMAQAWQRIWDFVHGNGLITSAQQQMLTDPDALERHTVLPSTLAIRQLALAPGQVERLRSSGTLTGEVLDRCAQAASLLAGKALTLKPEQRTAIAAIAEGRDVLALLPTGAGKSFCFQLPALVLPGLTVVISPLVSLMHDQALSLNHTIGGAVRALVGSLPESSSRAGRTEVVEQMTGVKDHKIRLVYVSPERLSQARFRDALTKGVADGYITRVAIDEAHTYVQWGEDFRPSFRRAGALLRTLRETYPGVLTLITLTATATPTVEQALREEVLGGLVGPATSPTDASPVSGAACTSRHLEVVRVNPLRPELTLVRRTLRTRGRSAANALAEQVLDAATGHTLIYCLTVREVEHVYAHLRDYLAGRPVMLRKFHGRMTEVEKAAVSGEFSEAAKIGQEGYAPMVVVATSAFGLGVSRDDIRNVLCLSPPTDLAALYQQLGRGGRDSAGTDVIKLSTHTYALALATSKSLDTAQWLASLDLPLNLLREFASAVLAAVPSGALDVVEASERLLSVHVRSGRLSVAEARERRTRDAWRVGLTRAVAALADLGVVIDHGDVPARVALTAGTRMAQDAFAQRVLDAVLALPARAATPGPTRASAALTDLLASWLTDPALLAVGFSAACSNVADLWLLLSDLHDTGVIEVSQRPNTHMLVGLGPAGPGPVKGIPSGFNERVSGKLGRAAAEAAHLRAFFAAGTQCLNARLADYFSVPTPAACCSTDLVRCNVCAVGPAGSGINIDTAAGALANGRLRPASFDPRVRAGRVDDAVVRLLRSMFNGATLLQMRLVLRGEDRIWSPKHSSYRKLSPRLTDSSMFGHVPALTDRELTASLQRLVTARSLVADGVYWRTAANFSRGPRRVRPARSSALPAHPSPPGTTAISASPLPSPRTVSAAGRAPSTTTAG